ncbi:hypothetical protein BCR37DRAFT_395729 [Protomyces lactucae-debilis]|uniref:Uncharacterized protein n=1 Tax=Protomyces lactucae-debilis TaxID=2754530 RepID=A0A1Y2ESQ0_PROLT|nr:uncharacterized protein BCR37DRAFT_395729 [Protomyces lactucae-debilis]ORY74567.1 hypothetical protein BCR37DRAFT_395729 [Protomyces lactucae-debilis]
MSLDRAPSKRWVTDLPQYDEDDYDDYAETEGLPVPQEPVVGPPPAVSLPAVAALPVESRAVSRTSVESDPAVGPSCLSTAAVVPVIPLNPESSPMDSAPTTIRTQAPPPSQELDDLSSFAHVMDFADAPDFSLHDVEENAKETRAGDLVVSFEDEGVKGVKETKEGAMRTPSILLATNTWAQRKQMLKDLKLKQELNEDAPANFETPGEWKVYDETPVLNTLVEEEEDERTPSAVRVSPSRRSISREAPNSRPQSIAAEVAPPLLKADEVSQESESKNLPKLPLSMIHMPTLLPESPLSMIHMPTLPDVRNTKEHELPALPGSYKDALPDLPEMRQEPEPVHDGPVSMPKLALSTDDLRTERIMELDPALSVNKLRGGHLPAPSHTETEASPTLSASSPAESRQTGKRKASRPKSFVQETAFRPLSPVQPISRFSVDSPVDNDYRFSMGDFNPAIISPESEASSIEVRESDRLAQELLDELQIGSSVAETNEASLQEPSMQEEALPRNSRSLDESPREMDVPPVQTLDNLPRRPPSTNRARSSSGSRFLEALEAPARLDVQRAMDSKTLDLLEPQNRIVEIRRRIHILSTAPSELQAYLQIKSRELATQHRELPLPAKPATPPQPQRFEKSKDAARSVLSRARRANSVLKNLGRRTASGLQRNSQELS